MAHFCKGNQCTLEKYIVNYVVFSSFKIIHLERREKDLSEPLRASQTSE